MTNFTMPGSEQQSQFAANCKNTCETSWKNEISTINAVDTDASMPNHAKYHVAINALARFAIVHNACRDVMLEPVLPVYGQKAQPNYYNQAPGAQPFYQGSVGQQYPFAQPYQHPYQQYQQQPYQQQMYPNGNGFTQAANHVVTNCNHTHSATLIDANANEYVVTLTYQTALRPVVEIKLVDGAGKVKHCFNTAIALLENDGKLKALAVSIPLLDELTTTDIANWRILLNSCFNKFVPSAELARTKSSKMRLDEETTDGFIIELSDPQWKFLTIVNKGILSRCDIYDESEVLV